jgi:hypothetical protein
MGAGKGGGALWELKYIMSDRNNSVMSSLHLWVDLLLAAQVKQLWQMEQQSFR